MITWSKDYETGVAMVDGDHKRLVEGLNQLETAVSQGAGSKQVPALLAFLERYAAEHFAREESCMAQVNCPTALVNKAAHAEFIARFAAVKARIEKTPGAAALAAIHVQRELSDWIVNHILRIDSALKTCRPAVSAAARRTLSPPDC